MGMLLMLQNKEKDFVIKQTCRYEKVNCFPVIVHIQHTSFGELTAS